MHPQRAARVSDGFRIAADIPHFHDFQFEFVDDIGEEGFILSFCCFFFVERVHVLVISAQVVVAAGYFEGDRQVMEPYHLRCLQEGLRRIFRNDSAVLCHGQEFGFSLRVGTFCRFRFGKVRIAVRQSDDGFHDDDHGLPGDALFHIIDILDLVRSQFFLALIDIPAIAALDEMIIVRGMVHRGLVGDPVGHDAGGDHVFHIFVEQAAGVVAERIAVPLGDDLLEFLTVLFGTERQVVGRSLI